MNIMRGAKGFDPNDFVQPKDVAAALGTGWAILVNEHRDRIVDSGAGARHSSDVVLRAQRR